jgi:diguanylate cyclase (GGDEF)-like protein/PAS domain S-box-containing protein
VNANDQVANTAGRILDVNEAYAMCSGYDRDELLSKTITELDALETPQETASRLRQLQQQGNALFETQHRRKDGTVWPVEVAVSYSPLNGGRLFVFFKDLTERKKVEEMTWRQANFDHLTGLANRALFFDRVGALCAQAKRHDRKVVVFFADLDGFKSINDTHGHDAGDLVLKTVASRWLAVVREEDTIARLGGDEFAVVLGDLQAPEAIAGMAEKLIQVLNPPMTWGDGLACQVGVSIGISVYPDDAVEATALISSADAAMYVSKKQGKNTYTFSTTGQGVTL